QGIGVNPGSDARALHASITRSRYFFEYRDLLRLAIFLDHEIFFAQAVYVSAAVVVYDYGNQYQVSTAGKRRHLASRCDRLCRRLWRGLAILCITWCLLLS